MSEMVMRVARALSDADQMADGDYRKLARAAIEAMREPTNRMLMASGSGRKSTHKSRYQAMIDEALATPPVEAKSEVVG